MPTVTKWVGDALEGLMASKMPMMKVTETEYISSNIKRVRFQGDLSGMNFQLGYAVIIRVSDTEYRNYTASFSDVESGILEIIFHINGSAPGSRFVDNIKAGDRLRISMPRGRRQYDPLVKQQLIFGDETSLGLACSFQPFLKNNLHQFQFYLELSEANRNAPQLLGLENYKVFPKGGLFRQEQLIRSLPIFKTPGWQRSNFILTGNAKSVQTFRKALKSEDVKGEIFKQGYWLEGKTGL